MHRCKSFDWVIGSACRKNGWLSIYWWSISSIMHSFACMWGKNLMLHQHFFESSHNVLIQPPFHKSWENYLKWNNCYEIELNYNLISSITYHHERNVGQLVMWIAKPVVNAPFTYGMLQIGVFWKFHNFPSPVHTGPNVCLPVIQFRKRTYLFVCFTQNPRFYIQHPLPPVLPEGLLSGLGSGHMSAHSSCFLFLSSDTF